MGILFEMYLLMLEAAMGMIPDQSQSTGCSEAQGAKLKVGAAAGLVEDSSAVLCSGTEVE